MATIGTNALTLRDTAEAIRNRDGSLKTNILDIVSQENGVLDDATFVRADEGDKLSSDFLNYNPQGEWVALGEGVAATKTGFSTAWDTCGRIKARIQIPTEVYERTKQKDALVERHVRAISAGMQEQVASAIFYANIANEPRKFNGLSDFYDKYARSGATRQQYDFNVINASPTSTAALRSIWLVGWGDNGITCFYPETSNTAGLTVQAMKDLPVDTSKDGSGKVTWHKSQEITWDIGLAVRNFQCAGRLCNIDLTTARSTIAYAQSLIGHLRHLRSRVKATGGVRRAFYMDENTWEIIEDALASLTQTNAIKYGDLQQSKPDSLWGIPIHVCDALDTNEASVSQAS